MAHTLSHTEVLNCSAEDAWECCKHSDKVLPDLLPEFFAKAEILEGNGGPGTLRALHFGPGIVAFPFKFCLQFGNCSGSQFAEFR